MQETSGFSERERVMKEIASSCIDGDRLPYFEAMQYAQGAPDVGCAEMSAVFLLGEEAIKLGLVPKRPGPGIIRIREHFRDNVNRIVFQDSLDTPARKIYPGDPTAIRNFVRDPLMKRFLIGMDGYYASGTPGTYERDLHMIAGIRCDTVLPQSLSQLTTLDQENAPFWVFDSNNFEAGQLGDALKSSIPFPPYLRLLGRNQLQNLLSYYTNPTSERRGGLNSERLPMYVRSFNS